MSLAWDTRPKSLLKVAIELPPELLYHVFENVQDLATIDKALDVVPGIVHRTVARVHSPRVVEKPPEYLTAFKRLERTTNVLVRVKQENLDTRDSAVSHLRGLYVEVEDSLVPEYTMDRLVQIFRVTRKHDDQLFKVSGASGSWAACYHNICIADNPELAGAFEYLHTRVLRPRCYYDLLKSVRPYVDGGLGRILDITLKYRLPRIRDSTLIRYILRHIGRERFATLAHTHMHEYITAAGYLDTDPILDAIVGSIIMGYDMP